MSNIRQIECKHESCGIKIQVVPPEGYSTFHYDKPSDTTEHKEEGYPCKFGHLTVIYWTRELPFIWRNLPES